MNENEKLLVQYLPYSDKINRVKKIMRETSKYYVILQDRFPIHVNKDTLLERGNIYSKWYLLTRKELVAIKEREQLLNKIKKYNWKSVGTETLKAIWELVETK